MKNISRKFATATVVVFDFGTPSELRNAAGRGSEEVSVVESRGGCSLPSLAIAYRWEDTSSSSVLQKKVSVIFL